MAQTPRTPFLLAADGLATDTGEVAQGPVSPSSGGDIAPGWALPARDREIAPRWSVQAYDLLGSTSDEARERALQGAPDGTVVWARAQSAGRGRRGRSWSSPEGNLHVSVVLRGIAPEAPQLGFVAALAVADAVDEICATPRTRLKWPNDVLIDGEKLAGLLLEVEQTPLGTAIVLGMGVNLRHFPPDTTYPATSLHAHGFEVSAEAMLAHLLDALGRRHNQWVAEGFDRVRAEWAPRGHRRGDGLRLDALGRRIAGEFVGLDTDGSLLALVNGTVERFSAAEIVSR